MKYDIFVKILDSWKLLDVSVNIRFLLKSKIFGETLLVKYAIFGWNFY